MDVVANINTRKFLNLQLCVRRAIWKWSCEKIYWKGNDKQTAVKFIRCRASLAQETLFH